MSARAENGTGDTHVDELEGVPDVEQRPGGLLEADDGCELEDVDADLEELVDDLAHCAEYVHRRFCDALRRRLAWNQVRRWGKAEAIAEKTTAGAFENETRTTQHSTASTAASGKLCCCAVAAETSQTDEYAHIQGAQCLQRLPVCAYCVHCVKQTQTFRGSR